MKRKKEQTETYHYYRLPMETEAGQRVKRVITKAELAWNMSAMLARRIGADRFTPNGAYITGGIGQFYFKDKPESKAFVIQKIHGDYFECIPNRGNEEGYALWQEILSLPVVTFKDIADVFGKLEEGMSTPAFFDYRTDIYIRSSHPLDLEGLVESSEGIFSAMNEARNISEGAKAN